jgi:type IV pilus assembly protein PilB
VNQVPVNEKQGLTFAAALRSILRQDPDTVLIGEIRDTETADIAIKAALTGHLVLSTLHTNDAPTAVARLIDMQIDPFMVASSVLLLSAQRLVRRLCKECKEAYPAPKQVALDAGYAEAERENLVLYRPKGCPRCKGGYKGRLALLETVPMTEPLQRLVIDGASAIDIKKRALEEGMLTLRRVGLLNAMRGTTSLEEVLSLTVAD